ncbi:uncharacterized protein LOC132544451 [Ylistrum balloti]|uniref:uncharacterized protein LOC132544451 n=1 Tax=Ylistrum balloti TaxID=509963 RepID=UPI0029058C5B|nr:uncharacterized protein LOC132544451 [Ylistrum balloti]
MKVLLKERRNQIDRVCEMQSVQSYNKEFPPFPDIFHFYRKLKIAVCKTHKTGTVILPKIVNILDTKLLKGRRKFNLTQYSINDLKFNINIDVLKERNEADIVYIIIGKNPYDRILDHFLEGVTVVSELNRQIGRTFRKPLDTVIVDGKSFDCGFQVDFQEYVDYLLKHVLKSGQYNPVLESPIARQCAPCNIKYTYMFKQETLRYDIFHVLNSTQMTPAHRKVINQLLSHEYDERRLYLEEYVTEIIANQRHHKEDCPEILALLFKTWESIKDQGLLHVDSKFPYEAFVKVKHKSTIIADTIGLIREEMKKNPVTPEQRTLQRQAKYKLYNGLDQITIDKIRVAYKVDFLMFGYDSSSPSGELRHRTPK